MSTPALASPGESELRCGLETAALERMPEYQSFSRRYSSWLVGRRLRTAAKLPEWAELQDCFSLCFDTELGSVLSPQCFSTEPLHCLAPSFRMAGAATTPMQAHPPITTQKVFPPASLGLLQPALVLRPRSFPFPKPTVFSELRDVPVCAESRRPP